MAVMFSSKKIPCRPSYLSSPHPKNNISWVYMRFLWHKTELGKTGDFGCYVFDEVSKKVFFEDFWPSHFESRHQMPLFRDETPGRLLVTVSEFLLRPTDTV